MTILIFLIVLAVIVFVHELGHFAAAKLFGVRVDAFKIGFGPKIVAWKRGETEYGINWLLFGGYVKIHGEDATEEGEAPAAPDPRSFASANRLAQATILASGVLFNFLFAWMLYTIVFASGVTVSTQGFERYAPRFQDPRIIVTYVLPGSPAEKAGLKEGDTIVHVGTVAAHEPPQPETIQGIQDLVDSSQGATVAVEYARGGRDTTVDVAPTTGIVAGRYAIGISMDDVADLRLPVGSSIAEGFSYVVSLIKETFVGIYSFFSNIFIGHPDFSDVAGPVGIAGIVGDAASLGWVYLLMVTALISVNLGAINLIPFPALDGARIVMVAIEAVARRRIPPKVANYVNAIGFGLIILLMIAITWNDVARLIWK